MGEARDDVGVRNSDEASEELFICEWPIGSQLYYSLFFFQPSLFI